MGEVMKMAGIALAETKFTMGGDIHNMVHHHIDKARVKVRSKKDNVAFNSIKNDYYMNATLCQI